MLKRTKISVICASALTVLAASAPNSFAEDSLEIRNFIGTIQWSNGDMSVEIEKNKGDTKVTGRRSLTVDGGVDDLDGSDCKSSYGRYDINWFGKKKQGNFGGYEDLENLPVLNISMPADTKLILRDAIVFTSGAPDVAEADLDLRYCGELTLGDVDGMLALDSRGSADVNVGTTGQLVANLKGSGDLTGGDSQDVLIESRGSADVELGDISSLELSIYGSGDLTAEHVKGSADMSSRGSGDIDLGDIDGLLTFSSFGSGDLDVESVNGEAMYLSSSGSGDIHVNDGAIEDLTAAVQGSGTIEYSGRTVSATLKTSGSGDIYVNRVTGDVEIKTSGSGDVEIDDRN